MMEEKNFTSAIFSLEWRGNLVGKVAFCPADLVGVDAGGQLTDINQPIFQPVSNGTGSSDSALNVPADIGAL